MIEFEYQSAPATRKWVAIARDQIIRFESAGNGHTQVWLRDGTQLTAVLPREHLRRLLVESSSNFATAADWPAA